MSSYCIQAKANTRAVYKNRTPHSNAAARRKKKESTDENEEKYGRNTMTKNKMPENSSGELEEIVANAVTGAEFVNSSVSDEKSEYGISGAQEYSPSRESRCAGLDTAYNCYSSNSDVSF